MNCLAPIILGDNQFFGINHMSEEKAQAQSERFRELSAILDVVGHAYRAGVRGLMLTAHDRAGAICEHLRRYRREYPDLLVYPALPYAHKYANAVNEKGMMGALVDFVFNGRSARAIAETVWNGGRTVLCQDLTGIMKILVDAELRPFAGLNVPVVFLQNIVSDLLLGCGVKSIVTDFAAHIRDRYGAEPGFITMNLPRMLDFLRDCVIENPIVCSSVNKIGYLMNPDIKSCETAIRSGSFRPVAMSILASGAVPPDEAVRYVASLENVRSIVFGASSRAHVDSTVELIRRALLRVPDSVGGLAATGGKGRMERIPA